MVRRFVIPKSERSTGLRYAVAVLAVVLVTLIRFPLQPILGQTVPFLLYFPAMLFAAWYGGFGPGFLVTVLGGAASTFFWMEPEFHLAPLTTQQTVQLGLFTLVAGFMSWMVDLLHGAVMSIKAAELEKKNAQEAVQSELERRVAEKTGELESKNQSLEALTYSLAHDLRAPMRSINSFGSILLEDHGNSLEPDAQQLIRRMINSSKHAEKLMADLLEYGRLAHIPLPISEVDTQVVLDAVLRRAAQDILDAGAKIDIARPLPKVRANETVLSQALSNLIGNAVKYTRDSEPPSVRIFTEDKGELVRLVVADHGPGIDLQSIPKLFKPFTRLDTRKAGSGLGLSIVAKGIERMGGAVGVDSKVDSGSRFWIELPKAIPQ